MTATTTSVTGPKPTALPVLLVDTSTWSLAFRRDSVESLPEVVALRSALAAGDDVVVTGLIVQELLQGFAGPKQRDLLLDQFRHLRTLTPKRGDHELAADLHKECRRGGVQLGTVDALLAALCVAHRCTMLTNDHDFHHAARIIDLEVWTPPVT